MEFSIAFVLYFAQSLFLISPLVALLLVVILGLGIVVGRVESWSRFDAIYWALITAMTVGYGDISPKTGLGQAIAAVVMILGYSIIAVPTGIVTVELSQAVRGKVSTQVCPQCSCEGHAADAVHCKACGAKL